MSAKNSAGLAYDEIVRGFARARWLHLVAFFAVALIFYARHATGYFTSCAKTCGLPGLLGSMVVWWPIGASWLVVRRSPALATSRAWRLAFCLTTLVMCLLYGTTSWNGFSPYVASSIVHAIVLGLAALFFSARTPGAANEA